LSQAEDEVSQEEKTPTHKSVSVGELLEHSQHLAFLAKPGGGKSTLVKRLATAYAFPSRLKEVADGLPERDWLPLILRCRELRDRAHRPFVELIDDIPRHVGLSFDECCALRNLMHARLQTGRALLLIDGLDEISEEGARHIFANNLRSFLAMFPQTAVVVTSREAGFRLIAGVVASACEQVKLAPLNKDEVVDLCERWHAEVVADTEKVRTEARQLGNAIWRNRSIRTLTENPLLLTTLLVVKRSAGELPRNRTSLYREAIRVLVRTWNVEGYAAMDESETLAQLSYVACAMMEEGTQQVGEQKLLQLLKKSRRELEAELQFAEISPQNFMERIEYRSSLLMQTGHARVDGILEPVYEFRHLTFQEYLAALGYVEEHYQGREDGRSLTDVLGPYLDNERWREVISLAAVLAKRKAEDLVKRIISCAQEAVSEAGSHRQPHHGVLLYKCLIDEVQLTAPTLKEALRVVARQTPGGEYGPGWATTLLQGRFGARFQELVEEAYISGDLGFEEYLDSFMEIALYIQGGLGALVLSEENRLCMMKGLKAESRVENIRAAMVCMLIAYQTEKKTPEQVYAARRFFDPLDTLLRELLASGDMPSMLAASWAFAWIGERKLLSRALDSDSLLHLYNGWVNARTMSEGRIPGWAFSVQSLLPRDTFAADIWGDCSARLQEEVAAGVAWGRYPMNAFIIGWYRRRPWTDEELVKLIRKQLEPKKIHNQVGHDLLRKINEERKLPLRVKRRKKIGTH
jgi:hypothetical protein